MAYSKFKTVNFGKSRTGLATVGFTVSGVARSTTGVTEQVAGSGIYGATVSFADAFVGSIVWDTGEGADTLFAGEEINPGADENTDAKVTESKLGAAGADAVTIETGINLRQAIALIMAAAGVGEVANAATAPVMKNYNGTATRIEYAVSDSDGNHSGLTVTPPA